MVAIFWIISIALNQIASNLGTNWNVNTCNSSRQGCSPSMSDSCSDTLRTPAAPSFTQPCSPDENLTGTFLPPVAGSTKEKRWKAAMEKRDGEERCALVEAASDLDCRNSEEQRKTSIGCFQRRRRVEPMIEMTEMEAWSRSGLGEMGGRLWIQ